MTPITRRHLLASAGIGATPAQDRLHFAAFDLVSEDRGALREWTVAAAEMAAGEMIGNVNDVPLAPPDDTGETVSLPRPSRRKPRRLRQ